jgi:predicted AAA+ superfamily ATPase
MRMVYASRLMDGLLDELLAGLPAIALDGAKGVGKTATAARRADTIFSLDDKATFLSLDLDPKVVLLGRGTTLIDEWQLVPQVWNVVRRAVDAGAPPGRFLLAGSATVSPKARIHSGAGRIVRLLMRPMSLPERGVVAPTVSLAALLSGNRTEVEGETTFSSADYCREILSSGFPGIRDRPVRARTRLLASYVDQIVEHDIPEAGGQVRRPVALRGWLAAYGAATATTASYASILDAATPGEKDKPAKQTAMAYRELLQRLWVLDSLPAWLPVFTHLKRLGQASKHHLVDPALAAALVGATESSLLRGEGPARHDSTFFGSLFESLAAQTVRVLAQSSDASVSHLRTQGGEREVDLIVEGPGLRVLAIEVKASSAVRPNDVRHLNWLEQQAPDLVLDKIILNTGDRAYRRPDGVAVIPLALLGP